MINNLGEGPRTCLLKRVKDAGQLLLLVFASHVQVLIRENVRGERLNATLNLFVLKENVKIPVILEAGVIG